MWAMLVELRIQFDGDFIRHTLYSLIFAAGKIRGQEKLGQSWTVNYGIMGVILIGIRMMLVVVMP